MLYYCSMFRILLVYFLLQTTVLASAQNIDSLLTLTKEADTAAVRAYNELFKHFYEKDPKQALEYTLRALELAQQLSYAKGEASSYNNIGLFYKSQGLLDKAVSYYLKSLNLNRQINNPLGIAYTLSNIGTVYSLKNDYNNALRYFMDAYHLLDSIGNEKAMIGLLNNLGNTYLAKGEDYRAVGFYKRAMRLHNKYPDSHFDPYANIGQAYLLHGEPQRAKNYYEKSLQYNQQNNNTNGIAYAYHNLAAVARALNNLAQALTYEQKALEKAQEVLNKTLLRDIHQSLAGIYEKQGNTDLAYQHLKLYISFRDLLEQEANLMELAQRESTQLLMEKDKQLAIMAREHELNRLKSDSTSIVVIISVMGAMIVLAVVITYLILKRQQNQV